MIFPGPGDLVGCPVVQARVRPVVVAVDEAADAGSGVVEGLVFVQPDLPLLEFPEPALDERLGFGVAVAAAAMSDLELAEPLAEAAGGERFRLDPGIRGYWWSSARSTA